MIQLWSTVPLLENTVFLSVLHFVEKQELELINPETLFSCFKKIFHILHFADILRKSRNRAAHLGGSYTHNLFSLRDKTREKKMENSLFYLREQSGREILQGMEENEMVILLALDS